MLTRREFLVASGATGVLLSTGRAQASEQLNDIHSQINLTSVYAIERPTSTEAIQRAIARAHNDGRGVSIAGGRHAMGGQQFGADTYNLDMTTMRRVLNFDRSRGLIEVQSGLEWPDLIDYTTRTQAGQPHQWGIVQKQTGADRLTIGGSISANAHGRGLRFKPMIQDVESFVLIDASGRALTCSRSESPELFKLAIGGYGLFGVISSVTLRLGPRRKVKRVVEMITSDQLASGFAKRIAEGYMYGDFQCSTETDSDRFLHAGVFSCYIPVSDDTPIPAGQKELHADDWRKLWFLGHADKRRAFEAYTGHYMATNGQIYWSDEMQLSVYIDDYHRDVDRRMHAPNPATEMITEIYVPPDRLEDLLAEMRDDFRRNHVELIYASVRLIQRDDESFLAWAKQPWTCVVLNLHVVHTPAGMQAAEEAFRRLIDMAIKRGGSYYLTYHHWATPAQVTACYPQFAQFLKLKRVYDPKERFQSDWYRHYRDMAAK
jgi:FAD/FMN-containing dehydrogenase